MKKQILKIPAMVAASIISFNSVGAMRPTIPNYIKLNVFQLLKNPEDRKNFVQVSKNAQKAVSMSHVAYAPSQPVDDEYRKYHPYVQTYIVDGHLNFENHKNIPEGSNI